MMSFRARLNSGKLCKLECELAGSSVEVGDEVEAVSASFAESLSLSWPEAIAAEAQLLGKGLLKSSSADSGRSQVGNFFLYLV